MKHIHILPDSVKNKIAAGEVVEGPFSVMKELMENAIDSGARVIDVEVSGSGLKKILVRDNGDGISREDLPLTIQEHATSKISSIEDIETITTCGFRGEALSSISSISKLTLLSRTGDEEAGGRLVSEGDRVDVSDYAGPVGTTVIVENLFYNIPARKKFMKSPSSELRNLRQTFMRTALAWPEISFSLTIDDDRRLMLPAAADTGERITGIYGKGVGDGLYFEKLRDIRVTVEGYVSRPDYFKSSRSMQMIYVNRRPVEYKYLGFLLSRAYEAILKKGQYPAAVLFITIDPDLIDVNIHPAKREVRFFDGRYIDSLIISLVRKALGEKSHEIRDTLFTAAEGGSPETPIPEAAASPGISPEHSMFSHDEEQRAGEGAGESRREPLLYHEMPSVIKDSARLYDALRGTSDSMRFLGTVFGTYMLIEKNDELHVIDFHAAHERVIYDSLMDREEAFEVQELMFPVVHEFSLDEYMIVEEQMELFTSMGFDIEPMPDNSIAVRGVPAVAGKMDLHAFFLDVVEQMKGESEVRNLRSVVMERVACHSAKRAGDAVNDADAIALAEKIFSGRHELRCPHGRPFMYKMGKRDFEKLFSRS
ncbi:MAG TPA: DNA mismatch repair endonuclease MutL [Spirochaetota bacterium]|nr:DNA mismatch repair endonuclease MutL [Spirochaetota bacterium]